MVATLLLQASLILVPVELMPPTSVCQLDVLTPAALDERALGEFDAAVGQYIALHRRLERALPPEQMFEDPEDMFEARQALATAIREARPLARQGNVFSPGVAAMIRARLERAMLAHGHRPDDVLAAINEERLPGMPDPEVNQPFPWGLGSAMWPTLLAALPELPRELEYRFWDRHLVLIDLHPNIVVDIMVDALPPAGSQP